MAVLKEHRATEAGRIVDEIRNHITGPHGDNGNATDDSKGCMGQQSSCFIEYNPQLRR